MQQKLNQIIQNLKEHQKTLPKDTRQSIKFQGKIVETLNEKSPFRNKYQDMQGVINVIKNMKPIEVTHETISFLQYGMFFDGGDKLYYDKTIIEVMDERILQVALLNQVFHFLLGTYFTTGSYGRYHISSIALYFSHLKFIDIKPKYSQSIREDFYDKFVKDEIDYLFYLPANGIGKYHIEKFINNEINYPTEYRIVKHNEFPIDTGTIFETTHIDGYLTKDGGMMNKNNYKKRLLGIRQPNGRLKLTTAQNKLAKELIGIKKTIDVMFEEA